MPRATKATKAAAAKAVATPETPDATPEEEWSKVLAIKVADILTFDFDAEQTVVLRGGVTFPLNMTKVAKAGWQKLIDYSVGRYLRDGATAFVTIPILEVQEWGDMHRWQVGDWMLKNGASTIADDTTIEGLKVTKPIMEKWSKLDKVPGFESVAAWTEFANADLNAAALTHAEQRQAQLYSGKIPVGRGRSSTLSPFQQTWLRLARKVATENGWSQKTDGAIPSNPADSLALFTRLDVKSTKYKTTEEWLEAFTQHAHNINTQEQNEF